LLIEFLMVDDAWEAPSQAELRVEARSAQKSFNCAVAYFYGVK